MVRATIATLVVCFCVVLAQESPRTWGTPQALCNLDNEQVNESSGIAASAHTSGVFYTHNDSGDSARFFRFQKNGKVDGEYALKGATAIDWEDMAQATVDGKSYLYLGDVGDNAEKRENITVYRVEEPTTTGKQTLEKFDTYTITYPDKPHNCETIFVTANGDIWIVTKNTGGNSIVFMLPKPKASGKYELMQIATLAIDTFGIGGKQLTGGDVSPDGKYVVLRTYSAALEYTVPQKFAEWPKSKPRPIRTALETQGEAICYSKDGQALLTTSEFAPCPVSLMALAKK